MMCLVQESKEFDELYQSLLFCFCTCQAMAFILQLHIEDTCPSYLLVKKPKTPPVHCIKFLSGLHVKAFGSQIGSAEI